MDFIQTANKQVDKFGAGKHGFSAGNPSGGIQATYMSPDWCDDVQQELVNAIEGAGIAIDPASQTQLYQAMFAVASASALPVGAVFMVLGTSAPTGAFKINGATALRASYAALWSYAQATGNIEVDDATWLANYTAHGTNGKFSPGDGATTFRLPDVRGDFPRFWSDGSAVDSGRAIGSFQADDFKSHQHGIGEYAGLAGGGGGWTKVSSSTSYLSSAVGGTETRGRNTAFTACIKY